MLTWNFYGEKSWEYIAGERAVMPYRVIFLGFLFLGAIGALEVIWSIADTLNGLMAAPKLIALIALAGVLARDKNAHMAALITGASPNGPAADAPRNPLAEWSLANLFSTKPGQPQANGALPDAPAGRHSGRLAWHPIGAAAPGDHAGSS